MPRYAVRVRIVVQKEYTIEAASQDEAEAAVLDIYSFEEDEGVELLSDSTIIECREA